MTSSIIKDVGVNGFEKTLSLRLIEVIGWSVAVASANKVHCGNQTQLSKQGICLTFKRKSFLRLFTCR